MALGSHGIDGTELLTHWHDNRRTKGMSPFSQGQTIQNLGVSREKSPAGIGSAAYFVISTERLRNHPVFGRGSNRRTAPQTSFCPAGNIPSIRHFPMARPKTSQIRRVKCFICPSLVHR